MKAAHGIAAACCAGLVLAGCHTPGHHSAPEGTPTMSKVTGTVAYRARIALPPTAVLHVQLADVSRADAPAIVIGERFIETGGRQVPIPFEIPYDPAKIDPRMTYAVQARIEDRGQLLFVNDRHYAVVTGAAPMHVDMELVGVPGKRP
jgi:putative lipoprotein